VTTEAARRSFVSDLRAVLVVPEFRRLFEVRLASQAGDGIITAGVGTYVFFNASSFPNPAAGAAAFAVLYLPYSLVGPFAGVFIDRWSRRQIMVWSALLRSSFVALAASFMALGNHSAPLYVAVLLVLGVNRFFLSALSAALPHVVAEDELVMANAVSPTIGGVMATLGGIIALGLNVATGNTERGAAITVLGGGACYVAASMIARTMPRDLLGPARDPGGTAGRLRDELASVAAGLMAGARYVLRSRGATAALGVTGGFSFLFGPLSLVSILLYRNYFYRSSAGTAEGHLGTLVVASGIGYFCAAVVTPPTTRRLSKQAWITVLLAASAVATAALGLTFLQAAYLAMGFCLYLARQGVAICATTILQEEVTDAYRGRVFAFYDLMFNVLYVAGVGLSSAFMPANGRSPAIVGLVAAGFMVLAIGYRFVSAQRSSTAVARSLPSGPSDMRSSSRNLSASPTFFPGSRPRIAMTSSPFRSGRILSSSSCSRSSAIRCSRSSYARASRSALRTLRVVQSARVSTCSRPSCAPASRTYRRTAESVHSASEPYPWNRRCSSTSKDTSRTTSLGKRSTVSRFLAILAPTTSW
jgi:Major Facilitator Superfamily